MPIVQVNMLEGRTDEQKERLIQKITDAVNEAIDAPKETIRVMLNEMPKQHYGIGGKSVKKLGR